MAFLRKQSLQLKTDSDKQADFKIKTHISFQSNNGQKDSIVTS